MKMQFSNFHTHMSKINLNFESLQSMGPTKKVDILGSLWKQPLKAHNTALLALTSLNWNDTSGRVQRLQKYILNFFSHVAPRKYMQHCLFWQA